MARRAGTPSRDYGSQAYPPSTYDRGASGRPSPYGQDTQRPNDAGGAERYGQPDRYDQGQGQGQGPGQDPQQEDQALARQLNLSSAQRPAFDAYRRAFAPDEARARARRTPRCSAWRR